MMIARNNNSGRGNDNNNCGYNNKFPYFYSCERELGEWNVLLLYGNTAAVQDLTVVADAAWHIANWQIFRDSVTQLEGCTPPELYYKHNLYKAMLLVRFFNLLSLNLFEISVLALS